jgi:hypothetical protein
MARLNLGHFCDRWRALNAALEMQGEAAATIKEADDMLARYQATPAPWVAFILAGERNVNLTLA